VALEQGSVDEAGGLHCARTGRSEHSYENSRHMEIARSGNIINRGGEFEVEEVEVNWNDNIDTSTQVMSYYM
jgi:hypothetical protein